jgi:hypothetical protein
MPSTSPVDFRTLVLIRDAWRATRGGPEAVEARQRQRLRSLVAFARSRSRYYANLYRGLPRAVTVGKPEAGSW